MRKKPSTSNFDAELFGILLLPSWLSGTIAIVLSLIFSVGTILLSIYQTSSIRVDYLQYQAAELSNSYQQINNRLAENSFISNLPLLVFWSIVGLVVYLFAANLFAAIHNTAELHSQLRDYVNVDRKKLILSAFTHLGIRLLVLAVWTIYIFFFFHHVIPYCTAAAIAGSGHLGFVQNCLYEILAVILMVAAIHLHTIMLRLLLLKPRLFSGVLYVD
jgi:hypothetical protein